MFQINALPWFLSVAASVTLLPLFDSKHLLDTVLWSGIVLTALTSICSCAVNMLMTNPPPGTTEHLFWASYSILHCLLGIHAPSAVFTDLALALHQMAVVFQIIQHTKASFLWNVHVSKTWIVSFFLILQGSPGANVAVHASNAIVHFIFIAPAFVSAKVQASLVTVAILFWMTIRLVAVCQDAVLLRSSFVLFFFFDDILSLFTFVYATSG
jgi:hypothetical protein